MRARLLATLLLATFATLGAAMPPAQASTTSIDHVEATDGTVRAVLSVADLPRGASPDLDGVSASFAGQPVAASARPLSESATLRRTAVLALDVSRSMAGDRIAQATRAAETYLEGLPDNVRVGLVTFAREVRVAQRPTLDREKVRAALAEVRLSTWTRVHDGLLRAVELAGDEGARSVLLLSDGEDTSDTPVAEVTAAVAEAGVAVDVVALGKAAEATETLGRIALAGGGKVLTAAEPAELSAVFAGEAAALAAQVLVTFPAPAAPVAREGTLEITLEVGRATLTDQAFVMLPAAGALSTEDPLDSRLPTAEAGFVMPREWLYAGLLVASLALAAVAVAAFGTTASRSADDLGQRIDAYTRQGARRVAQEPRQSHVGVTRQAVAMAQNVLTSRKGWEASLGSRLEAAGLALKPAEWLLAHAGVAILLGLLGLLLGGGNVPTLVIGLALGSVLPWVYLTVKRRRRVGAFKAQLADTLQLMAGSLSAGLSLAQSVDTVVREGAGPIASEFRRALVEARLGVDIEEALSGVAERMASVDFEWVVMAIRIQRDVGGNLSELLAKVSDTIREREYLERQIKTLSAEGRLSVWVLAGLPPGFMLYLLLANPGYLEPMYTHPLGLVMLVVMGVLLAAGTLWMKKLVKVEV